MTRRADPVTALPTPDEFAAAVGGDGDAARRVLRLLHPVLVRYCRGRLPAGVADHTAAEIHRRVVDLLVEPASISSARVYRLAREVVDAQATGPGRCGRGDRGRSPLRLRLASGVVAGAAASARADRPAPAVLATLPDELREVLVLRVVAGLGVADVAELLDLTVGAVRVAQHRALARLRVHAADPGVA